MNALPQTFRGEQLEDLSSPAEEDEKYGAGASAQYGDDNSISVTDECITTDTEPGEPELFTAELVLPPHRWCRGRRRLHPACRRMDQQEGCMAVGCAGAARAEQLDVACMVNYTGCRCGDLC